MELVSILEVGEWIWRHCKPAKLLLIVEDNSTDALALCEELKEQKIANELAATGEEALLLMRRTRFYAALVDLGLPGMSGLELANKMKHKGYNTRIFFVTGSSFINLNESQLLCIVRKPVTADNIKEMIV